MKILYGVQGTGNGHISRARAVNKYLRQYKIEVDFLFSGRDREKYFDMDEFGDWRSHRGLSFVHQAGKLKLTDTLREASLSTLIRDIRKLDLSPYDLVVTDFEPITAWAARLRKQTCIGLGHQYAFLHDVPRRGDSFITRSLMKHFAPCSTSLGLHWHHFGQAILPPIAETHSTQDPVEKNKILVYLGFEEVDEVMQYLEKFSDYKFVYYGPFPEYQRFDHIQLKPLSREGFKYDLATAEGVICNAGFELGSEAIQLGKKLLVKPLQGQLEQLSNARALEELGLAMSMDKLDESITRNWLQNFSSQKIQYNNVAKAIAEWIAQGGWKIEGSKDALIETLWRPPGSETISHNKVAALDPKTTIPNTAQVA